MDKKMCPDAAQSFPIRELSARTGVNSVTLRAWERRYGLLKPARTAKGHRLYTQADCQRVESIVSLIHRGVPVGQVKHLLDKAGSTQQAEPDDEWSQAISELLAATADFNAGRIESLYNDLTKRYPLTVCIYHWLVPVLESMSLSSLVADQARLAFLWSVLVQRLNSRLQMLSRGDSPGGTLVLVGETAALNWRLYLLGLELAEAGFRVHLLDPPPIAAWQTLLEGLAPDALIVFRESCWPLVQAEQLEQLAQVSKKPVVLAGLGGMLAQQKGWLNTAQGIEVCVQLQAVQACVRQLLTR